MTRRGFFAALLGMVAAPVALPNPAAAAALAELNRRMFRAVAAAVAPLTVASMTDADLDVFRRRALQCRADRDLGLFAQEPDGPPVTSVASLVARG